jgi:hypothetical protein
LGYHYACKPILASAMYTIRAYIGDVLTVGGRGAQLLSEGEGHVLKNWRVQDRDHNIPVQILKIDNTMTLSLSSTFLLSSTTWASLSCNLQKSLNLWLTRSSEFLSGYFLYTLLVFQVFAPPPKPQKIEKMPAGHPMDFCQKNFII